MTDLQVTDVRFEQRRVGDALGIGVTHPRVSWLTSTGVPGWWQAAYEVEVSDGHGSVVVTTGRVESDESVLVPWQAEPLISRARRQVRVRVWGRDGSASAWSDAAEVEAGLLAPDDWRARFVGPTVGDGPAPLVRRGFTVDGPVARARLHVSALGVYEVEINGRRVGDHVLAPGWTSYDHRLRVETFDVTDLLRLGPNAIGALLGDGWYRGRLGWQGGRSNIYGERLGLLAQLEVTTADGATQMIATDGTWRWAPGPILASSLYDGETYDAGHEVAGWSEPGVDDDVEATGWGRVEILERDVATLVARTGPPVRRTEEIRPVAVTVSPSGRTILDFGQNLVGRLRITVAGESGTTVTLRHAEVLEDGELCTAPLRQADATDRYTLRGDGPETWEPRFTFHGFRYAEIDGWPGGHDALSADPAAVTAVVCHSDMERTGWFSCSDDRVTRLHENVVWGTRGNFLDVPTDCPQRDERLGWTGDLTVFAPTACYLYDCAGFLASWLADLAAEQGDDGAVPLVVPDTLGVKLSTAVWGDAAVVVPAVVHQRFGDTALLRDQYPSMRAWVDHVVGLAGERRLWDTGFQFGDWLDPHAPADNPRDGRTDPHLVATATLCHTLDLIAGAADALGEDDDARRYRAVGAEVRAAFAHEYVAPSGLVASDSQTAYALALAYGLLPDDVQRQRAGRRLASLVRHAGHRIATGFVGTPLVCDALCDAREVDTAYELLMQEECPSWLYPVLQGATTIWERWDGILPDGRVNAAAERMNSFNHYALGAVADWLHRTVGGLAPAAPGYRALRIAPVPGGGLTWASSVHRTPYGTAEASWRIDGNSIAVTAVVPPSTSATVVLPSAEDAGGDRTGGDVLEVGPGRHGWRLPWPTATATASAAGAAGGTTGVGDVTSHTEQETA